MAITNLQEAINQMRAYGNIDPEKNNDKKSAWEKMMAQLSMAQKMSPDTMAGFALGRLLRGGFDQWKENYDKRGELKAQEALNGGVGNNPNAQIMYGDNQESSALAQTIGKLLRIPFFGG